MRSTVVPGWGQLATDRPLIGKTLLFITGLMAISGLALFLFVEPVDLVAWLSDPDVLLAVVLANIVFAGIRLFSTGHAWWAGGGHRWFAAMLLAVIVAIPHVAIAWVGLETRDSLLQVFSAPPPAPALVPQSTTTTTTRIELTPVVSAPGQYGDDVLTVSKGEPWRPFGEDRLNILLLGGDSGPGRGGLRTDTMIVASTDPISGEVALFGVPRNFGAITLTDGTEVPVRRLNHVYWWGRSNPERFDGPDPGAAAVADAIAFITGLQIDYFALVDLTGFADVVDAFGGVTLDVPGRVYGPLYEPSTGGYEMIVIEPGTQTLDGGTALAYARARYGSSDYARMTRQRCMLSALARQADPLDMLLNLGPLLETIEANVATDIPADMLPELVRLLLRIDADRMRVVGFDSTWSTGRTEDKHPIADVDRIRHAVRTTIEDPEAAEGLGVATAGEACA